MFENGGDARVEGGDLDVAVDAPSVLDLAFASMLAAALDPSEADGRHGLARPVGATSLDSAVLDKASALSCTDLAASTDDELVDAVVGWQQVGSWVAAGQARAVGELLARGGSSSRALEAVTHELTAALVTSRYAAGKLVGRAVGLAAAPAVADALADGRIDTARADALLTADTVPWPVRDRVAADLVGTATMPGPATGLTPAQLRDRLRRAAIESDPAGAARRAETAAAERHVWIDPAPDQMAWLTALLPASDAARAWARVDGVARHAVRQAGEVRTLGQLRADALTQLVTTTPVPVPGPTSDAGAAPTGGTESELPGARTGGQLRLVGTVVNVTVPASTLLGLDESPAQLAGYGPVPAPVARALAADGDATWRRILTDPTTGAVTDVSRTAYRPGVVLGDLVRTRDPVCTFPGCRVPSDRCDLDHVEPFDPAQDTLGQTRARNLHPVCRAHHNAKTHGGWSTRAADDGTITWCAPSGHEYEVPPTPTDTRVEPGSVTPGRRDSRAGPRPATTRPRPSDDHDEPQRAHGDPPPF